MYSNTLFLVSENNFQKYRFQWVSSPKDYPFRFYPLIFCGAGKRATFYLLFIYLSLTQIQWYVINPKGGLTWTAYIWACIMNRIWMLLLLLVETRRGGTVKWTISSLIPNPRYKHHGDPALCTRILCIMGTTQVYIMSSLLFLSTHYR